MTQLPSSLTDKTTGWQKVVAFGLMGGVAYLIFTLLAAALPTILLAAQSLFWLTVIGIVFGLPTLYCVTNPLMVWGFFKTLAWNFTKFLIKMDPLSVMDRYVEYLAKKLKKLGESITVLLGKKEKGERELATLEESYDSHMKTAQAALKQGKQSIAATEGLKAQTDKGRIERLKPLLQRTNSSLQLMQQLEEASSTTIDRLTYQIQSKRSEYELNREIFKGLKSAEDFISSDNDAAKLYGQSVIELEEQTTQYIGYIDGFEQRSKSLIDNIAIEKQAGIDAGLAELEQYMRSGDIMLPNLSAIPLVTKQPELIGQKSKYNF